jgi:hypothetical protein
MKALLLLLFLIPFHLRAEAEPDTLAFQPALMRLKLLGDSLLKGKSDQARTQSNTAFSALVDSILNTEGGRMLSFKNLESISVAVSEDGKTKLITWMLIRKDELPYYSYFGYLLHRKDAKAFYSVVRLDAIPGRPKDELENLKLAPSEWHGCIYYAVVHQRHKKYDHYLLLGWAPQSQAITRKLVEPLRLQDKKIQFGAPLIRAGGKAKHRLVFDYNAQATMTLRYDERMKLVVMDHLSPSDPRPEAKGMYNLYGPDFSYDGLKFEKGHWNFLRDIDVRNR